MDDQSIAAINKSERIALNNDGVIGTFDVLLDSEGDVTEDLDDAIYVLICFPDAEFEIVKLDEFGPTRFN